MINLSQLSDEQLKAELKRRENKASLARFIPAPVSNPDWSLVKELCVSYLASIAKENVWDEDMWQYINEATMKAVYGPEIWDWINEVRK